MPVHVGVRDPISDLFILLSRSPVQHLVGVDGVERRHRGSLLIVVVVVITDGVVQDVGAVLLEERRLPRFDSGAFGVTLPVPELAAIETLAGLLLLDLRDVR